MQEQLPTPEVLRDVLLLADRNMTQPRGGWTEWHYKAPAENLRIQLSNFHKRLSRLPASADTVDDSSDSLLQIHTDVKAAIEAAQVPYFPGDWYTNMLQNVAKRKAEAGKNAANAATSSS